jgi:hypothetical protein
LKLFDNNASLVKPYHHYSPLLTSPANFFITFFFAAFLIILTAMPALAEIATPSEMDLAGQNWLNMITYEKGSWAETSNPQIT